jgi:hypothetical protein
MHDLVSRTENLAKVYVPWHSWRGVAIITSLRQNRTDKA